MPQLAKGGKWVFGWCMVGPTCEIQIPPEAYVEYGFQQGETVIITRGSRRSGGVGIGRVEKLQNSILQSRFIGKSTIGANGRVALPPEAGVQPGERLLVVRGSGLALGFLLRGPIVEEALKHPEIETYEATCHP
jgi:hypothetical protein